MAGFTIFRIRPEPKESICIGCGCSDTNACFDDTQTCYWLKVDRSKHQGVCSKCSDYLSEL